MKICNIPYWSFERWRPPLISFTNSTIFVCCDLYNSLYWSLNMALERKEEVFCLFLCMHNENAMIQLFPTLFGHMTLNTATVIPSSLSGIILKSWVFLPLQNLYGHGMMRRMVGVYDEGSKCSVTNFCYESNQLYIFVNHVFNIPFCNIIIELTTLPKSAYYYYSLPDSICNLNVLYEKIYPQLLRLWRGPLQQRFSYPNNILDEF